MSANNTSVITVKLDAGQARTEAKGLDSDLNQVGKSAASAGLAGSGGLSQLERQMVSTRSSAAALRLEIAQNRQAMAALSVTLAELKASGQGASDQAMRLTAAYSALETETTRLVASQGVLNAETGILTARKGELKNQIDANKGGFDQLTTRINVGRGVLSGYDAAIEGVVRSFGGINLGWAVAIGLASTLLPKIIGLASETTHLVKISDEYVALTAFIADNGNLVVQSNGAQAASAGALSAAIERVVVNQELLIKAREQGAIAEERLSNVSAQADAKANRALYDRGIAYEDFSESAAQVRKRVNELAGEQDKLTKEVAEGMKAIDAYRAVTHQGSDAVLDFARQQKYTNEQLDALKQALDEDINKMSEFAAQAAKAATHARSLAEATIAYNLARATTPPPGFSNPQFSTSADTAKFAQEVSQNLSVAVQQGAMFREAVLSQEGPLRSLQKHFRETTLSVAGYNAEIAKLPDNVRRGLVELELIQKGMKVFADHTRQAESAAKALATTTSTLQKELENANAALDRSEGAGRFDQREQHIKAEIEAKRRELAIKKQLTDANNDLLRQTEIALLQAVTNDHVKARESEAAERKVTQEWMSKSLQPGDIPAHSFKEGMVFFEAPDKKGEVTLKISLNDLWPSPFVFTTSKPK